MAAFIISLPDVDTHIDDKKIFAPTCKEIATLIDDIFAKTVQLAEIPDFINLTTVQTDSDACAYHGRSLGEIKNILDETTLTIWTHLYSALQDYYSFITSASPAAWHCLHTCT